MQKKVKLVSEPDIQVHGVIQLPQGLKHGANRDAALLRGSVGTQEEVRMKSSPQSRRAFTPHPASVSMYADWVPASSP